MNHRRLAAISGITVPVILGAYIAICTITDTWKDVLPSVHVVALVWCVIGGFIAAIIASAEV